MRGSMRLGVVWLAILMVFGSSAHGADRAVGDTQVFATVGYPGHPGGIARDGDTVYVNTFNPVDRALDGYDAIFAYSLATGALLTDRPNPIRITRRMPAPMGFAGMTLDAEGRLYVSDMTGRVLRVDPLTGAYEIYATFPNDSATSFTGMPADVVFDEAGNLYVADGSAPVIWRVPPGGGEAEAWFVDPLIPAAWGAGFGGLAIDRSRDFLYFAMNYGDAAGVYRIRLDAPDPLSAEMIHVYPPGGLFGSAGLTFGASGDLYVVLLGEGRVSILAPDGTERARIPSDEQEARQEVPYDDPLFMAFDDRGSILLTNASFPSSRAPHWSVVFDVWVDDTALAQARPSIAGAAPRLRSALYAGMASYCTFLSTANGREFGHVAA